MIYYLAIDIGASSGRHILGHIENDKIVLEEIYRFKNSMIKKNGHLCFDTDMLFDNIIAGLKECKKAGKLPQYMGIDTWAVDFVLLDENNEIAGDTVAYRDGRTKGIEAEVEKIISFKTLYKKTGIQKQPFNSIYQLMAIKNQNPEWLLRAKSFLMLPDYLNFRLTGVKRQEYTNASSTGLLNAKKKEWDFKIIKKLKLNKSLFSKLSLPKEAVGGFKQSIKQAVGFDCTVLLPATHDTASAFMAVPARDDNAIYISSGTWSLVGTENKKPITTSESMKANLTNEGGYEYRYRYLKNIMGLWMIQNVKKELNDKYSFSELEQAARESEYFESTVDVNSDAFLAPESMIQAVKAYCSETKQNVPKTNGEIMQCIYNSLAKSYAAAIKQIENLTDKKFTSINIVGGGSKDSYLNELTAKYTGLPVFAGPSEGTALGNIMALMLYNNEFSNLKEARAAVKSSFNIKEYNYGQV